MTKQNGMLGLYIILSFIFCYLFLLFFFDRKKLQSIYVGIDIPFVPSRLEPSHRVGDAWDLFKGKTSHKHPMHPN
jgi:hypothetical protein